MENNKSVPTIVIGENAMFLSHYSDQEPPWGPKESFTFKGGEEHIKLSSEFSKFSRVTIFSRIKSSSDFMKTLLCKDALDLLGVEKVDLVMPYVPYARQDRVMEPGESMSLKVFSRILNSSNFASVTVVDPHSDVCVALIDRVKVVKNYDFIENVLKDTKLLFEKELVLVAPDAGASKKIYKTAEAIGFTNEIVLCEKKRNLSTREIERTDVHGDVKGKTCLIVDDICDGGRTFSTLGEVLKSRGAKKVYLAITHGIFSYGEEPLKPHIDHVWSSDSFREFQSDFVTFLPWKK